MPTKYVPYFPNTIEGQAILDNFTRSRRVLHYRDNTRVYDRIRRGLPLYEVEKIEEVRGSTSQNDPIPLPTSPLKGEEQPTVVYFQVYGELTCRFTTTVARTATKFSSCWCGHPAPRFARRAAASNWKNCFCDGFG